MKKKVIIAATALMLATTSVVSAAAIWGKYKGYEIVRVNVNGEKVNYQKTPAINVDGINMIPTSTLTKLGVNFTYDSKNKTINLQPSAQNNIDFITKSLKPYGISYVSLISNGTGFKVLEFYYDFNMFEKSNDEFGQTFSNAMKAAADANVTVASFVSKDDSNIEVQVKDIKDYLAGKIEFDTYYSRFKLTGSAFNNTSGNLENSVEIINEAPALYSNDLKTYLGKLTSNEYDNESIFNEYGSYGSKYGAKSIFNEYGTYGGKYSNQSPFNEYATKPPAIVLNGKVIGYLTLNTTITGAISPAGLVDWLEDNGY